MNIRGQSYDLMFFHTVEKSFPYRGKLPVIFSIPWKNRKTVFHTVENAAWKDGVGSRGQSYDLMLAVRRTWGQRISFGIGVSPCIVAYSTRWHTIFHGVEITRKIFHTVENQPRCPAVHLNIGY